MPDTPAITPDGRRVPNAVKRWVAIAVFALFGTMLAPAAVSASQGSVPAEVSAYAADPAGLVSRLDDLFGPSASGEGIEFGETTKVGQLNRVFTFTEDFLAGLVTDNPVELINEWSAPILIDDEPVGLATIWINPATVTPELAEFETLPELAIELSDVAAEAFVIHDHERQAWFTLVDTTLTTRNPGLSEAPADLSLDDYQDMVADAADAGAVSAPMNGGVILSVGIILAAALAVILVLLIPTIRGRSRDEADDEPEADDHPEPRDEHRPMTVAALVAKTKAEAKARAKKAKPVTDDD